MDLLACVRVLALALMAVECGGMLISLDSAYVNIFRDPIGVQTNAQMPSVPHVVIYDGKHVTSPYDWNNPTFTVPAHVNFVSFNMWSGKDVKSLKTFKGNIGTIQVTEAEQSNSTLRVEMTTAQKETLQVRLHLECVQDGEAQFTVHIPQKNIEFSMRKTCKIKHTYGLMLYTENGDVVARDGLVTPAYNVHDSRGVSYISTEGEGLLSFIIKSVGPEYTVTSGEIHAYEAPEHILDRIAASRPGIEEEVFEQEVQGAKSFDEDSDYYQDDDDDDHVEKLYDSKEGLFVRQHFVSPKDISQIHQAPISDVCKPSLSGEATSYPSLIRHTKRHESILPKNFAKKISSVHMKQVIKNLDTVLAGGSQLDVDFRCVKDGIAIVELVLNIEKHKRAGGTYTDELKVSWIKICESRHVKGTTTSLMGFDIRLGAYIDGNPAFYAVRNGRVTPVFDLNEHEIIVSAEETQTSFYATIAPEVWFNRKIKKVKTDNVIIASAAVKIAKQSRSKGNDICEPVVYGRASHEGVVTLAPLPLVVHYNCKRSGSVVVQLNLDLKLQGIHGDEVYSRIRLGWIKKCERVPTKTLQIKTISPSLFSAKNMHMKPKEKKIILDAFHPEDVVVSGVVNKAFSPKTVKYMLPENNNVIAFEVMSLKKKSSKTPDAKTIPVSKALEFSQPKLVSSSTVCHASIRPIEKMEAFVSEAINMDDGEDEGTLDHKAVKFNDKDPDNVQISSGNLGMFAVNSESSAFIVVDMRCVEKGTSILTLTIPFEGNHRAVISWRKVCDWPQNHNNWSTTSTFLLVIVAALSSVGCMWLYNRRQFRRFLANKTNIKYFKPNKNTPSGFEPMQLDQS